MRKALLALLAVSSFFAVHGVASADGIAAVVNSTTNATWTRTVYNDSGADMVSGEIVVWDNDDTEFDRSGYPYVDKSTTADSPWVAGVVAPGLTCPDQSLCEIVIRGMAIVKIADATDAVTEDRLVSTSTVSGQAGDYTAAADSCFLGMLAEARDVDNAMDTNRDRSRMWVNVDVGCE